jgi:hypothetical protein
MFEVGILVLEALEAVYLAIEGIYERFFKTDEDGEDEHQSGGDET